jgi:hypothetical protein
MKYHRKRIRMKKTLIPHHNQNLMRVCPKKRTKSKLHANSLQRDLAGMALAGKAATMTTLNYAVNSLNMALVSHEGVTKESSVNISTLKCV